MKLSQILIEHDLIVENGPIGTRLKYGYGYDASHDVSKDEIGKKILISLYKGDIEVARQKKVPIILNAATYRANRNHLAIHGVHELNEVREINRSNLQLIIDLRDEVNISEDSPIILGAPLGSMFDAYSLSNIPSANEACDYHSEQVNMFKEKSVDYINAVTLPTISESLGVALACDLSGMEYTIGFILGSNGKLLDGTSLSDAIDEIDSKVQRKPIGYLVTCTHPSVIGLIDSNSKSIKRLIGIKANGSCLPPVELAKLNKPLADDPEKFAVDIKKLKEHFNFKILSGCCGTTTEHLFHIIKLIRSLKSSSRSLKVASGS